MIVLASTSASRQAMLRAAGVPFEARPADVDERAIEARCAKDPPAAIAQTLADAKALAISAPEQITLGSDSLIVVGGRRFDKPGSREEAAQHLRFFSGKMMELHAAASLARNGQVLWQHGALAQLQLRELSDVFIARYLDEEWPAIAACAGAFRIEGIGVQLFETITGSHFTVLGMPLLPVLQALRDFGALPQ